MDRIELQEIQICLDFRLPETAPSEDLFENLFTTARLQTADTDDMFQEAWGILTKSNIRLRTTIPGTITQSDPSSSR